MTVDRDEDDGVNGGELFVMSADSPSVFMYKLLPSSKHPLPPPPNMLLYT